MIRSYERSIYVPTHVTTAHDDGFGEFLDNYHLAFLHKEVFGLLLNFLLAYLS